MYIFQIYFYYYQIWIRMCC